MVAKSAGILVVALAAVKLGQIVVGLTAMALGLRGTSAALTGETAALAANTVAQRANAASRGAAAAGAGAAGVGRLGRAVRSPLGVGLALGAAATGGEWIGSTLGASMGAGSLSTAGSASRARLQQDLHRDQLESLTDRGMSITNEEQRVELMRDLRAEMDKVNKAMEGVSVWDGAERDSLTKLRDSYLVLARAIHDVDLADNKRRLTQAAGVKADQADAETAEKLAAYQAARADDLRDRREARKTQEAIDSGASGDMADRLADLRGQLAALPALTAGTADEAKARDAARDRVQEQIDAVEEARGQLWDKIDKDKAEREKQHLQDQLKLVEELGNLRIAQSEKAGGTDLELALRRKAIEDDIAAQRIEIEDKIGASEKESDEAYQARGAAYRAAELERENTVRDAGKAADGDKWSQGLKPGDIDARVQRSYDTTGRLLTSEHGVAKYGRTALGSLGQPSMLDTMTGPGWDLPRRTVADLAPTPERPAQPGAQGAGTGGGALAAAQKLQGSQTAGDGKIAAVLDKLLASVTDRDTRIVAKLDQLAAAQKATAAKVDAIAAGN